MPRKGKRQHRPRKCYDRPPPGGEAMSERISVSMRDGIADVKLNRPDKLNAFFGSMRDEIGDALEEMARREDVRVVVITGRGRAFCAGADVGYMADLLERGAYDEANLLVTAGRRVIRSIIEMPKPVIAALNGAAAGGGANMALACDLRIASERAAIGQTFNRIGLAPDWGGSWLVPRLVGRARAAELFFLADMVDAEEAERMADVADETGRVLVEAFHWRYHPLAARMRSIVESGDLGVQGRTGRRGVVDAHDAIAALLKEVGPCVAP